jgi:hypothetical protein
MSVRQPLRSDAEGSHPISILLYNKNIQRQRLTLYHSIVQEENPTSSMRVLDLNLSDPELEFDKRRFEKTWGEVQIERRKVISWTLYVVSPSYSQTISRYPTSISGIIRWA